MAKVVRGSEPDVALITECGTGRKIRKLAAATGMQAHHGSLPPFMRRIRNAVLVRPPLSVGPGGLHAFDRAKRRYPRGAFFAQVTGGGVAFWVICVHLGLSGDERLRHAKELMTLVATLDPPIVIGGDLNESPGKAAAEVLAGLGSDAWTRMGARAGETFPAAEPRHRIDYVFTSREVRVEGISVPGGAASRTASDHLPVVADLAFSRLASDWGS